MRPKLNANTVYILVPDGIYLRSNGTSLSIRGKNLDHFLELLPTLNGHYTLEEITQRLSPNKKTLVTKFLETLLRSGFLKDTSQDQHHALTQAVLATYASDMAFIDSFQTSAASRFASFRNKQLLIIGSGLSFTALVQASLRCGIKQTNIIRTPECGNAPTSQSDLLDLFSLNDPAQQVQLTAVPQWDDEAEILKTIQGCDALLHISDRPMLARAQMLNRLCIEQKKTFIQAIVVDDHAWIGPLVDAENGACWECAWRRLQSHLSASAEQYHCCAFCDHTTSSISQFLTLSTASMIANRLIFELFKHCTQAGPTARADSLTNIHLATLFCENHRFLPHPHCYACKHATVPTATQFLAQMQQLQHQAPLDPATFCDNMAHGIDKRLGLFTSLDTDDFAQAPLAVYKVELSNPMLLSEVGIWESSARRTACPCPCGAVDGLPGQELVGSGLAPDSAPTEDPSSFSKYRVLKDQSPAVIGVGIDRSSAKMRACQLACEQYAASLVDPCRLLHGETIQQQTLPTIPVEQFIGVSSLLTDVETWTWALDLHTQQACLIPAPLAFPTLQHGGELKTEDKRGIGSGMSWAEALCQALFDWCTFLTLEQIGDTQQRYAQIDLTMLSMTPEGAHLHHMLQTLGKQVTVYDVTGTLQVPTLAIRVDKSVITYCTHCDVAQALCTGLRQALQQYQSTQEQQPEYAVVPVSDLPVSVSSNGSRKDIDSRRLPAGKGYPPNPNESSGHTPGRTQRTGAVGTVPCTAPVPTDDHRRHMPYQMMPEAWPARQEWLQQTLHAHGLHAWALPLDHDPALVQVFPYVVRVLLTKI